MTLKTTQNASFQGLLVIRGRDRDAVSVRRIFGNTYPDGYTFRHPEDEFSFGQIGTHAEPHEFEHHSNAGYLGLNVWKSGQKLRKATTSEKVAQIYLR